MDIMRVVEHHDHITVGRFIDHGMYEPQQHCTMTVIAHTFLSDEADAERATRTLGGKSPH
jgi:hypothetical protein